MKYVEIRFRYYDTDKHEKELVRTIRVGIIEVEKVRNRQDALASVAADAAKQFYESIVLMGVFDK